MADRGERGLIERGERADREGGVFINIDREHED